jgi:hypothetical protein
MDDDAVFGTRFTQESTIVMTVVIVEKDGAPIHAPLSDMEGQAGQFQAWLARHLRTRSDDLGEFVAVACQGP